MAGTASARFDNAIGGVAIGPNGLRQRAGLGPRGGRPTDPALAATEQGDDIAWPLGAIPDVGDIAGFLRDIQAAPIRYAHPAPSAAYQTVAATTARIRGLAAS